MSRALCSITGLFFNSILGGFLLGSLTHAQDTPADWIRELSSERHSTRIAAEKKLWKAGDAVTAELEKVASGGNPEAALRASKLLRYIQWGLTPETPEEIIKLTERFPQLNEDQKNDAYQSLIKLREFRLALLLYRNEKDPEVKAATRDAVNGLAIISARASILAGKPAEAKKTLEEFRDDPQNLVALAWLARAEGNLDKEIAKVSKQQGRENFDYHLALLRAKGNRQMIAEFAEKHDLTTLHASMELLEGRPEPWLKFYTENIKSEHRDLIEIYQSISMMRLKDPMADVTSKINVLSKASLKKSDSARRWTAINSLNALGEIDLVEKAVCMINPNEMFSLYVDTEKIDKALKVIGLDPQNPDYHSWLKKEMDSILRGDSDYGVESIPQMLSFLERRGLMAPINEVFVPQMIELAKEDVETFNDLLDYCFYSSRLNVCQAPESGILVSEAYAKDDPVLWGAMLERAFGLSDDPNPTFQKWYDYLAELYPEERNAEIFRRTLQLFRKLPITEDELNRMDELIGQSFNKAKKDEKEANRRLIVLLLMLTRESRYGEWLGEESQGPDTRELMRQERWKEAAAEWQEQANANPDKLEYLTWSAVCYRKAGMIDEAKKRESLMDYLIMGDYNMMLINSTFYQAVGLSEHTDQWFRNYLNSSRTDSDWMKSLFVLADKLLANSDYEQAHAYYLAFLLSLGADDDSGTLTLTHRYQNKSRMAQAFSLLGKDRKLALTMLESCHQKMTTDASLADEFFPSLRKARLMKEHDVWFEKSWQEMMVLAERFPKDDNIRNSAAWLAARCVRRLDDAEKQSEISLTLRPRQAAYLDTMAEIWFARANREKAVAWSRKAIDSDPSQDALLEQYFRFQSGDFPQ
jgi:hypothetical protein